MAGFSLAYQQKILNAVLKSVPLVQPAEHWLALYTVNPTDAGGGTEVPTTGGTAYSRAPADFADPTAVSPSVCILESNVNFNVAQASWGQINGAAIWSAVTGGEFIAWAPLQAPVAVNQFDEFSFLAADFSLSLD